MRVSEESGSEMIERAPALRTEFWVATERFGVAFGWDF
jgi:hypothetical protein